ncbi:DUF6233 domain-containing protein [Streptomyces abikoensis]|uniref:DUF6233 domain-containing protein n=1 Tax=Streptomyces abikoensis TaxID=97398 RepID=A0ABW7T9U5_9ACTN
MNDLPPDLPRLRTVEMYLELQLQRVRKAIADQERHTQAKPAAPETWVLQHIPSTKDRPINWLHRASCHLAKGARLDRKEALLALAEPGVQACDACHADQELKSSASA